MMHIDLLIHSAAQIVTCAGSPGPRRGPTMADVGIISGGAVAVHQGKIVTVGPNDELRAAYTAEREIDAAGRVVCPGFVDPHTHLVYAGDRVGEFEWRIAGASYMEIMASGGGIISTMRATRAASLDALVAQSLPRLRQMLALGTTTAEVKTGYGLNLDVELRMLKAIATLADTQPVSLVPTFLPAHALPPEFAGRADDYIDLIIHEMLPAAVHWHATSRFAAGPPLFVDVFCERDVFNVTQSRRVLEAGRSLGIGTRTHVDQFSVLGGLDLALELGAISVSHLDLTGPEGIALLAESPAVAVITPTVTFNLGGSNYAHARAMIDAGVALALTTDINPGSSPCPSMQLVMAISCRYQRLLPAEAMLAATINAAYAIGMGHRVGSLEPGKDADILIIDAPDYRHLAYEFGGNLVGTVMKQGCIV